MRIERCAKCAVVAAKENKEQPLCSARPVTVQGHRILLGLVPYLAFRRASAYRHLPQTARKGESGRTRGPIARRLL